MACFDRTVTFLSEYSIYPDQDRECVHHISREKRRNTYLGFSTERLESRTQRRVLRGEIQGEQGCNQTFPCPLSYVYAVSHLPTTPQYFISRAEREGSIRKALRRHGRVNYITEVASRSRGSCGRVDISRAAPRDA